MARKKYAEIEKNIIAIVSVNLREILEAKGMPQSKLAEITGLATSTIGDYVTGKTLISPGNLQKIADALGVKKSDIDSTFKKDGDTVMLPVYEDIACGHGCLAMERVARYEPTPQEWLNGGEHFYLRAKGDSMSGARIQDGDLLLIRKQSIVDNGDIAAVLIDDEAILKRVYFHDNTLILQSENPNYPPKVFNAGNILILGKLKKVIISL